MKAALVSSFAGNAGGDYVNIAALQALGGMQAEVDVYPNVKRRYFEALRFFGETVPDSCKLKSFPNLLPPPYQEVAILGAIGATPYDLLILNDNVPYIALKSKARRILVYVHFPHWMRIHHRLLTQGNAEGERYLLGSWHMYDAVGKLAWRAHSMLFPLLNASKLSNERLILVANSAFSANAIEMQDSSAKTKVLHPPVQARYILNRAAPLFHQKQAQMVYAGRVLAEKGVLELVGILGALRKGGIPVVLNVVGPVDPLSYHLLMAKARAEGVDDLLRVHGYVERRKLLELFISSKIYIHPNGWEPFGISVVEAMAAGCIPIVRKGPGGPWQEILNHEENLGFGYDSPDELVLKVAASLTRKDPWPSVRRALQFDAAVFQMKLQAIINQNLN